MDLFIPLDRTSEGQLGEGTERSLTIGKFNFKDERNYLPTETRLNT